MTCTRGVLITTAAAAAAVVVFTGLTLPDRAVHVPAGGIRGAHLEIAGAIHVHTDRSDGTGSVDEVAAAAARAGLGFVAFTDHGDGTRPADPPAYRSGVLCLDGVEISTDGGHYLALGMAPSPYPLGGEPRDVVEDVARLNGIGFVAHPDSPKPELMWRDWTAAFDGLEWLNADSEWRNERTARLVLSLLHYLFRGPEAIGSLVERPERTLGRWDRLTSHRPVTAIAGADAHARLGLRRGPDPYEDRAFVRMPSYESSFRAFTNRVILETPLTGDAGVDAENVIDALRRGRLYTVIDALATPGGLQFDAATEERTVAIGGALSTGTPVELQARATAPEEAEIVLFHDGEIVARRTGPALEYRATGEPAAYRVEVRLPGSRHATPVPWIVSNPIYVREQGWPPEMPARTAAIEHSPLPIEPDAAAWSVEHDPSSQAGAAPAEGEPAALTFGFRIASGTPAAVSPYAALMHPLPEGIDVFDRVSFVAGADRPLRVSVQLRLGGPQEGERWRRSVYVGTQPREITVTLDEMTAAGPTTTRRPAPGLVRALLFVIDTTHAVPGFSGEIHLRDVRLER
jgi:hypothetical protein